MAKSSRLSGVIRSAVVRAPDHGHHLEIIARAIMQEQRSKLYQVDAKSPLFLRRTTVLNTVEKVKFLISLSLKRKLKNFSLDEKIKIYSNLCCRQSCFDFAKILR